jgi:hypothetical protein
MYLKVFYYPQSVMQVFTVVIISVIFLLYYTVSVEKSRIRSSLIIKGRTFSDPSE